MSRRAALLATLVLVVGCNTWHAQTVPAPSSNSAFDHPVRVTRSGDSTVVLSDAYVSGDSLVGRADDQRVAIALTDVRRLDERQLRSLPSSGFVFESVAVVLGVLVMLGVAALVSSR